MFVWVDLYEVSFPVYKKMREHLDGRKGIGEEGADNERRGLL